MKPTATATQCVGVRFAQRHYMDAMRLSEKKGPSPDAPGAPERRPAPQHAPVREPDRTRRPPEVREPPSRPPEPPMKDPSKKPPAWA